MLNGETKKSVVAELPADLWDVYIPRTSASSVIERNVYRFVNPERIR